MFEKRDEALRLFRDIDPDFLEALAIEIGWAYPDLYRQLATMPDDGIEYVLEQFRKRRGDAVTAAMVRCADRFGIPYRFIRLHSNGQAKLVLQTGRITIIQEPIIAFNDHPTFADYKRTLAETLSYNAQLELDLGDLPRRHGDWSGSTLAVLLHGPTGLKFSAADTGLGNLMLGLPDAGYQHWVQRFDLAAVANFGRGAGATPAPAPTVDGAQQDYVKVMLKRKNIDREVG